MALHQLIRGIDHRLKKMFHRPFRVFDIGWLEEKRLKHRTDHAIKTHLYKDRYKVSFRDANEFLVSIDELFIKEFYKFKPDTDRPRIIDCGSYIGTSILYFKLNYPHAIVTGFEPDPSNFSLLQQNLDNWAFDDTKAINAAVWIDNDGIAFSSAGNMSSRIDREAGGQHPGGEVGQHPEGKVGRHPGEKVRTVRLSQLLDEPVDFLKIDIEGAELPVLKDCATRLRNVRNLFIEYHGRYERSCELNEILDILLQQGFRYSIKEGGVVHARPFWDKRTAYEFDMLLNIFAFRD